VSAATAIEVASITADGGDDDDMNPIIGLATCVFIPYLGAYV
jgi:hypothetical protein